MKSKLHILIAIVGINLLVTLGNTHTLAAIQSNSQVYAAEQIQPVETNPVTTENKVTLVTAEYFSEQNEIEEAVSSYAAWKSIVDQIDSGREFLEVPNENTSFKSYMDYNCITDDTTKQWELQQTAYTDEYGLRKVGTDYCVAVGSYYSETVGERFQITLDNGNEFTVIISDLKQDKHTDSSNRYSPVYDENGNFYSANILEFIVDVDRLHSMVTTLGTVSYYSEFEGNIVSIEKI